MKRLLLLVLIVFGAVRVTAVIGERDMVRETEIERQLEKINPALVDPFRNARVAFDRKDYAESERLLGQVVQQAPTFDPAVRRLGASMVDNGKRQEGLRVMEQAVKINRSAANLATLAYGLAYPVTGASNDNDRRRAFELLLQCQKLPNGDDEDILMATAQLALGAENLSVAEEIVAVLKAKFPTRLQTHFFAAYLAAGQENWIEAENEIHAAEKLGLDHEEVQKFLDSGIHSRALIWRSIYGTGWTVAAWLVGLGALCGLGFLLSGVTLRQIERSDPRVPITGGEQVLRKIYRWILNIAGVYYYISLPVVLLLVVLISGAILYGFFAIGRIPIQFTVMLVIGVFVTIWAMVKSLFIRVKTSDPGRLLERAEAEGLWQLSEAVAQDLDTRPIDEIRITIGTDLCVYERGNWREKFAGRAKRVLVVGTAVLNDFKIADFRSVLAHEYGHFSNRDTAGGEIAMRVQNDMLKFYYAMAEAGQATWMNVAFHFLRFYNFIFRRISHGATRLQEVLADRVAALHYGPAAFEGGLRHVIRRHVNFDFVADREINAAVQARRPISNLYAGEAPKSQILDGKIEEAINRPTTPDDTHPGPLDRFRLIAGLPVPAEPAPSGLVWDLFSNREAITQEMMVQVEKNIARHRAV